METSDYRARVYARYSQTHIQSKNPPTAASIAYDAVCFGKVFGPLLPPDKKASIFEVGCGSGSFLLFLQQAGYAGASGMDQDAGHIEAARGFGVKGASLGDARAHLAATHSAYDCIVAIDVIEHFTKGELFGFLDDVTAALKPGGVFLWRSPNADGPFSGRLRWGDLTHELSFTRASAWQLMSAAGFTDILIRADEPVVTGLRSLLRAALWQVCKAAAKLYLFVESYAHEGALLSANLIVRARKPLNTI